MGAIVVSGLEHHKFWGITESFPKQPIENGL